MRLTDADALRKTMVNYFYDADVEMSKAIVKGINLLIDQAPTVIEIPQNATNGDVIKATFPNREVHDGYTVVYYGVEIRVDRDFWEAPYKAGEDKE